MLCRLLKTLEVGTEEYARQEDHFANLDSKFRLHTGHRHHELSDAEAKIYFDSYQRMTAAVKAIATDHNISLVVRIDSKDMEMQRGHSVARGIRGNVIYHDNAINITDAVMRHLEQQSKKLHVAIDGSANPANNCRTQ